MTVLDGTDNPVLWQEYVTQARRTSRHIAPLRLLAPFVVVLMIAAVASTLDHPDFPTRELGIVAIWIVHTITAVYALNAGADAISREHMEHTWDSLVLTGLSARRILLGKWRAVLRRTGPWMVLLGFIRLAMIPIFLVALVNYYGWLVTQYGPYIGYSGGYGYSMDYGAVEWVPWASILAVTMTVVLTILDILCCTAVGLAASALTRNGIIAKVIALAVRFSPVLLFAVFTRYELGAGSTDSYRVLRFAPFAIADGGTAPLSRLSVPRTPISTITHVDALGGLFLSTALIIGLLLIALGVAWVAIRLAGALPDNDRHHQEAE